MQTKKKFDDCLMLDQFKNIAETSACNIFWIKNDVVFTSKHIQFSHWDHIIINN